MVNFNISKEDAALITLIVERAKEKAETAGLRLHAHRLRMDITAVHAGGCKLRLWDLAAAEDIHLMHDVLGIDSHIDRDTGLLASGFRPRFAVEQENVHAVHA